MGNIRQRQDNVSNIQDLLPTCIDQFTSKAVLMVEAIKVLDKIEIKKDDVVKKKVETHLGSTFTKEKKYLYGKWVEDIVGDDDSYQNLVENLKHHTKLTKFENFKKLCENDA